MSEAFEKWRRLRAGWDKWAAEVVTEMGNCWREATRQAEARMRVELNETANANYIAGKEQGEKQIAEARLKEAGWWALQRVEYGSEKATKHIAELERDLAAIGEGK